MNGQMLKGIRTGKGLTQPLISQHLGITTSTYSQKETGKSDFTINEIGKLAELLELNIDQVNMIFFDQKLTNRAS